MVLSVLVQRDLQLRGELVNLSVRVTAVVSAALRAEDLRDAGDADTRGDPTEDRGVVGPGAQQGAPVLGSAVFDLESGLLCRSLDQLECVDAVRVLRVVQQLDRRGGAGEQLLGPLDVNLVVRAQIRCP